MSEQTKDKTYIKKRILPTLLISLILPLMVTISVPFEVFANNSSEFVFNLSDFLPTSFLLFFIFTVGLFFVLLFLPKKAYRIASAILISISLMYFIQGTYLNQNLTSLQGDNMGSEASSISSKVLNTFLWGIVILISIVLACLKDEKKIFSFIGVIVAVIVLSTQVMTPLSISLTNKGVFLSLSERLNLETSESTHKILSYKNITKASSNKNIYYFCIDRFDELYAEHAYEKKPQIFEELTGFTWFQDNISIYGHTYPAVANMLTLNNYDSSKSRSEFLKDVYTENTTLSALSENGYSVNLYTDSYYSFLDASKFPSYVNNSVEPISSEVTSKLGISIGMTLTSLYRGVPTLMRSAVGNIDSSTCNAYVLEKDSEKNPVFNTNLDLSYNSIINRSFESTDQNNFAFIHTSGCHNVNYSKEANNLAQQSDNIVKTVEKNFDIVNKYIKYLKQQGLYENATIIITGDHSHPVNDMDPEIKSPRLTALFVKPANSSNEPLVTSQAQVSHDNIWATIMKSANISSSHDYGTSVFDIPEGVPQTRRYIWHTYFNDFVESTYSITGAGSNFANWHLDNKTTHYGRSLTD